jgi:hypothetical protein
MQEVVFVHGMGSHLSAVSNLTLGDDMLEVSTSVESPMSW